MLDGVLAVVCDRFGPPREIEAIIRFACAWAYYGGPPDDELFVQFGVTRTRFAEILHLVIAELDCDPAAWAPLTEMYPLAHTSHGVAPILHE